MRVVGWLQPSEHRAAPGNVASCQWKINSEFSYLKCFFNVNAASEHFIYFMPIEKQKNSFEQLLHIEGQVVAHFYLFIIVVNSVRLANMLSWSKLTFEMHS